MTGFWTIAFDRSVVARAARIAAVVGLVLAAINHGDKLLTGTLTMMTAVKILLTFLVPYCVSTYSSVMAVREKLQSLDQTSPR